MIFWHGVSSQQICFGQVQSYLLGFVWIFSVLPNCWPKKPFHNKLRFNTCYSQTCFKRQCKKGYVASVISKGFEGPSPKSTSPTAFLSQVSRCQQRSGSRWWSHTIVDLSTKQPVPQLPKDLLSESAIFRKMHFFFVLHLLFFFSAVYRQFLFEKTFNSAFVQMYMQIYGRELEP